jgi:hypothetical protein
MVLHVYQLIGSADRGIYRGGSVAVESVPLCVHARRIFIILPLLQKVPRRLYNIVQDIPNRRVTIEEVISGDDDSDEESGAVRTGKDDI